MGAVFSDSEKIGHWKYVREGESYQNLEHFPPGLGEMVVCLTPLFIWSCRRKRNK